MGLGDKLTNRMCQAVGSFDHRKVDVFNKIGKGVWKAKEHVETGGGGGKSGCGIGDGGGGGGGI
jgi:hypothetical protein